MTYDETTSYLYNQLPVYQQVGAAAYKPGLDNSHALDEYFGHPHRRFRTIHVGGTNGKGSTSHLLSAILQKSGYKVGLYTSPHLIDFRERIRVNGQMIDKQFVIDFAALHIEPTRHIQPSFFELTMMMAFDYFAREKVDVAIIEVGLGGRLDSTNIIDPDLAVITNISFDHMQYLGNTLPAIAREKAGIIKANVPVVIGEATGEVRTVFEERAAEMEAPAYFAEQSGMLKSATLLSDGGWLFNSPQYPNLKGELGGLCQEKNAATVLTAVNVLKEIGYQIPDEAVYKGFAGVTQITGLLGRWQRLGKHPDIVCDTGHNTGGMDYIIRQLENETYRKLHFVIGMVNDKDVSGILGMLPKNAIYYFTQASVSRALPAGDLQQKARAAGLDGEAYPTVAQAFEAARQASETNDFIFIGGSTFIVADLLAYVDQSK